uniref:Uncharacterized protein n=1 Tax=Salix viminalis TaxID=40686 RepID=A0A6N2LFA5_SALVM
MILKRKSYCSVLFIFETSAVLAEFTDFFLPCR